MSVVGAYEGGVAAVAGGARWRGGCRGAGTSPGVHVLLHQRLVEQSLLLRAQYRGEGR